MVSPRRPDFYIVGAPKCGTTAMYDYLRQHPDLFLPERKELRYFGSDLEIRDRQPLTAEEYMGHFADAPPGSRIGTAYVWYLYSKRAAAEIAQFTPEARILAMVRNPVDMLPALHAEHLTNGNEDIRDFASALAAEPDRRAGKRIPPHAHLPQGLLYTEVPRYTEQLERYVAAFGREAVHVIVFDDFATAPADAYRGVLRFLGASDDFAPTAFEVVNPNRRLRSERLRHFLARPPDAIRIIARGLVPRRIRQAGHARLKSLNVVTERRPPLPDVLRDRLRRQFAEEVERLSAFLGRDLSHWTAEPVAKEVQPAAPSASSSR